MRHERELILRPTPDCPAVELPADRREGWHTVKHRAFAAQIERIGQDEILGVTVYEKTGQATLRWWLTAEQSCMQSFQTVKNNYNYHLNREPGRVYEASIGNELRGNSWSADRVELVGTEEDEKTVLCYLRQKGSITEAIDAVQRGQREKMREAKKNAERARLKRRLDAVPAEPEGFDAWIQDGPLRPYRWFIYHYTGKKEQEGVCTHCGNRSSLPGLRYGETVECPWCRSELHCVTRKRLPRHGLSGSENAALLQMAGEEIVVRSYRCGVHVSWDDVLGRTKERVWIEEEYRRFLDAALCETREVLASHGGRYSVSVDGWNACGDGYGLMRAWICPAGLEAVRQKVAPYTPIEELAKRGLFTDPDGLPRKLWMRPDLEYLIKMGLFRMAAWELAGQGTSLLRGASVTEKLGVDKQMIRLLREADPSGETLMVIRDLEKCGVRVDGQDMKDMERLGITRGCSTALLRMARASSLHKALRYIEQQMSATVNAYHVLILWTDYLEMAGRLGIDLKDGMRLFPRKLKVAHDEAAKVEELRRNKKIDAEVEAAARKLEDLCWEFGGMTIRPATSQTELWQEGKTLNHCVGRAGYAKKMVEGKSAIFLIRKKNKPDTPYVTLELRTGGTWEKLQCYGRGDAYPGPAVEKFVKKWVEEIVWPRRLKKKGAKTA